jgi:hypothetical protein
MRLHPSCVVVLMLLLVPATSRASDHVASIFGGYSDLFGSHHKGIRGSLEVSWPTPQKIHDHVGILADVAVHGGTDASNNKFTKTALLVGLRGIYKLPAAPRLVLFAHGLIGRHRSQTGNAVESGWAGGAGFGGEVLLFNMTHGAFAAHVQLDWVRLARDTSPRTFYGVGYKFK